MCNPAPPAPPSASATAQAQTDSNIKTATAQTNLNQTDQVTPQGSRKYTQIGTNADGTPKYQATTTYSPQTQALYDTTMGTSQNLATLAKDQSTRLPGLLANPIDWDQQRDYLTNFTDEALDPSWDRQGAALDTALAHKGIMQGSTAYNDALDQFRQSRSRSYNAANVSNYNTALQSQLALRNQPLNEILALAGQGQIMAPQFAATPQSGVAGTDVSGLTNSQYNAQWGQYQNAQNQNNQLLGGLFGLGASALTAFSDRRLKRDIVKVGKVPNGLPLYSFRYLWDEHHTLGAMADEVADVMPDAVGIEGGFLTVDYGKLLGLV